LCCATGFASVGAGVGGTAAPEAVVDRLAALEARFHGVPVFYGALALFPAEEDDFIFDAAGEVEEAGIEVLDLDADFVDFSHGLAGAVDVLFDLGAAGGDFGDIDVHAAGEVDAAGEGGEFGVDGFGGLFAFGGAVEQGLNEGKEGLSFF
jgi:hypothetical protein